MIKFAANKGNRRILGFGLSRANIEKLTAGQPIHVWLDEMGLEKTDLFIFFGETEEQMQKDLLEAGCELPTDPGKIHIDPKLRS